MRKYWNGGRIKYATAKAKGIRTHMEYQSPQKGERRQTMCSRWSWRWWGDVDIAMTCSNATRAANVNITGIGRRANFLQKKKANRFRFVCKLLYTYLYIHTAFELTLVVKWEWHWSNVPKYNDTDTIKQQH